MVSDIMKVVKLEIYNFLDTKSVPDFRIYQQMRYVTI